MDIDMEKLRSIVGEENASNRDVDLYVYSSDASIHQARPDAVVRPVSIGEVQDIVRYANESSFPVIARGAGSSMSGHTVPIDGGIVMDMRRMSRIIEVRPDDRLCIVEPGVVNDELNRSLKPYGLFFPPAPSSGNVATIGGMIGTNASGNRAVKYGATRDSVIGMKVVLASGELVTIGSNTMVESSGYQLTRLMAGSEGTLGIVVEATLLLSPVPKFRSLGLAHFNKLSSAGDAVTAIMTAGPIPSMLELMDDIAITAVNNALGLGIPDSAAILIFECDGLSRTIVQEEMEAVKTLIGAKGGYNVQVSDDTDRMEELYQARKKLFPSLSSYRKGLAPASLADDMAVPISRISETIEAIHAIARENDVVMSAYGHCGQGLIHTKLLIDPESREQWENARNAVRQVYDHVNRVGGTTSGEHGIGLTKGPAMAREHSDSLELMRTIKKAMDPNNILNPHKLMDAPDDWINATSLRYELKG